MYSDIWSQHNLCLNVDLFFQLATKQFGVTVVICGSIMNAHSLQKLSMKL